MKTKIALFYTSWTASGERFLEAADQEKVELVPIHYSQVVLKGKRGRVDLFFKGTSLAQFDLFYFRSVGDRNEVLPLLLEYAQEKNIPVVDEYLLRLGGAWRKKKSTEAMILLRAGVSYPDSFFVSNRDDLRRYLETYPKPLVMKSTSGRHGVSTFLVRKKEEIERVIQGRERVNFLIQEFIPNEGDYRLFLVGYRVVGGFKRQRKENQLVLNRSQGGSVPLKKIPLLVKKEAEKAARVLGIEVAGVDLVEDKRTGKVVVIEVNQAPEFFVMERKTGQDIAREIVIYLRKKSGR